MESGKKNWDTPFQIKKKKKKSCSIRPGKTKYPLPSDLCNDICGASVVHCLTVRGQHKPNKGGVGGNGLRFGESKAACNGRDC